MAPGGTLRHKPSRIEATAEGYALLHSWLETWGSPEHTVMGLEATGSLWEPLYDALTRAGYTVLVRESASDRFLGLQLGLARQDGWDRCADAGPRPVGGGGPREHLAVGDRASATHADARPP